MAILRFPVDITFDGPGSPGVNVFHGRAGGLAATIESQAQDIADALNAFYVSLANTSALGGIYNSTTTVDLGVVVDVETQEQYTPTFAAVSGNAGTTEAPQVLQIVVGWRTAVAARRGMGRTFCGPCHAAVAQSDGSPVDLNITTVSDAAAALVTASQGLTDCALGVWGLDVAGTGPDGAKVLRDFTSSSVKDKFAVLRSRRD